MRNRLDLVRTHVYTCARMESTPKNIYRAFRSCIQAGPLALDAIGGSLEGRLSGPPGLSRRGPLSPQRSRSSEPHPSETGGQS